MASIASEAFHSIVQQLDNEARSDINEEGLHAPTLLEVLDFGIGQSYKMLACTWKRKAC